MDFLDYLDFWGDFLGFLSKMRTEFFQSYLPLGKNQSEDFYLNSINISTGTLLEQFLLVYYFFAALIFLQMIFVFTI